MKIKRYVNGSEIKGVRGISITNEAVKRAMSVAKGRAKADGK